MLASLPLSLLPARSHLVLCRHHASRLVRALAHDAAAQQLSAPELLQRCSVVLVEPGGPANVGAVARLCQNFGARDLRLVRPGPFVVDAASGIFAAEAVEYAVSAAWLLNTAGRHADTTSALGDASLVFATSARARDPSMRVLTPRQAAAEALANAASGGRVAFLFGSERTGLANEDMDLAHAVVAIPTAVSHDENAGIGAGGKYSLNLSHAVGILVYELLQAAEDSASQSVGVQLQGDDAALDTNVRSRLVADLTAAVRSLDVLRDDDDDKADAYGEIAAQEDVSARDTHDMRALARAVSGATVSRRGAKPLFSLARRVLALARLQPAGHGLLDEHVLRLSASALRNAGIDVTAAAPPSQQEATPAAMAAAREARDECVRALRSAFRDGGAAELNLTKRELHRLVYVLSMKKGE